MISPSSGASSRGSTTGTSPSFSGNPSAALLARRLASNGALVPNGDGAEWTGDYAFTQALRYRTTQEPAALAGTSRLVEGGSR